MVLAAFSREQVPLPSRTPLFRRTGLPFSKEWRCEAHLNKEDSMLKAHPRAGTLITTSTVGETVQRGRLFVYQRYLDRLNEGTTPEGPQLSH